MRPPGWRCFQPRWAVAGSGLRALGMFARGQAIAQDCAAGASGLRTPVIRSRVTAT